MNKENNWLNILMVCLSLIVVITVIVGARYYHENRNYIRAVDILEQADVSFDDYGAIQLVGGAILLDQAKQRIKQWNNYQQLKKPGRSQSRCQNIWAQRNKPYS